ncbi:hypothetical protein AVEN_2831-1 [Araneus ventricosus]|uniref:Uncharacterized protein n=1 Tax=Araneus ventricosus TaxID=182803 RepID=A0A4Y2ENB2_ARAVE|nr:hypothetical protein AVEN_2831-1 [Araneus ventricosus]
MTRTTPELAPPLQTSAKKQTVGRLATTYDLACNRPYTRRIFSGIWFRTCDPPVPRSRPYHYIATVIRACNHTTAIKIYSVCIHSKQNFMLYNVLPKQFQHWMCSFGGNLGKTDKTPPTSFQFCHPSSRRSPRLRKKSWDSHSGP